MLMPIAGPEQPHNVTQTKINAAAQPLRRRASQQPAKAVSKTTIELASAMMADQ